MSETGLLIAAVAIFAYALIARRLSDWILTAPMVFLGLGWGMTEAGLFHVEGTEKALHLLAEATLVIVLFSDAAAVDLVALRKRFVWPERMLLIGLPAAMALGTLAGWILLPGWPIWEVALLAAILAPTDAALGQAVVTNPAVPDRVRRALTVESGLNDGLALPAVLFFGCIAVGGVHDNIQTSWLVFAAEQIGLAALSGAAVGWLGGRAMRAADTRLLSSAAFEGIGVLALAGMSYLVSTELGGNGFLAAFVGGLAFGAVMKGRCRFVFEFMETEGQILVLATFLLIGAALLPEAAARIEPVAILLILISLFAVRPAAIWLSLWRTDAPPLTKGFLGWFGPRGLATVLFALLVVGQLDALKHGDEILTIAAIAVALSAVLHGVSAAPGARWYGGKIGIRGKAPTQ
ncbi:MAG: cation:proton antiporter [Alphaproteobacteria bacterium]